MPYIHTRAEAEAQLRSYIGPSFDHEDNARYSEAAVQALQAALNNLEGNTQNFNGHSDQGLVGRVQKGTFAPNML